MFRASLRTPFYQGILIFSKKNYLVSFEKIRILWKNGVSKLALRMFFSIHPASLIFLRCEDGLSFIFRKKKRWSSITKNNQMTKVQTCHFFSPLAVCSHVFSSSQNFALQCQPIRRCPPTAHRSRSNLVGPPRKKSEGSRPPRTPPLQRHKRAASSLPSRLPGLHLASLRFLPIPAASDVDLGGRHRRGRTSPVTTTPAARSYTPTPRIPVASSGRAPAEP